MLHSKGRLSSLKNSPVIEIRGLTKRFGRVRAVEGLDLSVPHGSLFGFLGPNGAGKSTTIRALTGLIRPTSGEVLVLGVPVEDRLTLGRRVGALVEEPSFYPYLTAWQNLSLLTSLSGGCSQDDIAEVLETVDLSGAVDRPVGGFSHGMRQRLGIAQALLPRPELLILDEPASGLDPQGLADVRNLLRRLHDEGLTIFLSSHLLAEVELTCTHVAVVARGQVVAQGEVGGMLEGAKPKVRFVVDDPDLALNVLGRVPWVKAELVEAGMIEASADAFDSAELNEVLVREGVRVHEVTPMRRTLESFYMDAMRRWRDPDQAGEGT